MTNRLPYARRVDHRQAGIAAVEIALILPLLLFLIVCVIDFARGIQANMILINLSREAANLSSRGTMQLSDNSQTIIGSVAASAPPLDMNDYGMIYITKIMGTATGTGVILEQYRWDDSVNTLGFRVSGYAPASHIWTCSSWSSSNGSCTNIPTGTSAPVVSFISGLANGEVIYAVECFYQFNMVFSSFKIGTLTMPVIGPNLYSMTVF
jgi:hypothetical protein